MKKDIKYKTWIFSVISLVGILYYLAKYIHPFGLELWMFRYWTEKLVIRPFAEGLQSTLLNIYFLMAVAAILLLEKIIPAKPQKKILNIHIAQDIVWMIYQKVMDVVVVVVYVSLLHKFYNHYLNFLTVYAVLDFPIWVRVVWGILLIDFISWFHHWLRHKVSWFWEFHAVHHSQQLSIFTDFRYHVVEYFITRTISTFPLMMLSVDTPKIIYWTIFHRWIQHFYHGNIKTNFGILRYILVTPQSHRIHHSKAPEHRDKNFGLFFSVWDHMFNTQYRNYDEYPDTGIEDEHFPQEYTVKGLKLLTTPFVQMAYPFRVIAGKLMPKKAKPNETS